MIGKDSRVQYLMIGYTTAVTMHSWRRAHVIRVPAMVRRHGADVRVGGSDVRIDAIQVGIGVVADHVLLPPHVR